MLARVAESLYWMSRYLERAEHIARLLAVTLEATLEQTSDDAATSWTRVAAAVAGQSGSGDAYSTTDIAAFDRRNGSSLVSCLGSARDNARQVREQLSTEVWEHLNRLYLGLQSANIDTIWVHHPAEMFRQALEDFYTLGGVTYTTLRHGEGWHFLELGRYIERAQLISRLLDIHFGVSAPGHAAPSPPPKYLDWLMLLKFCCAFEPYLKEHTADISDARIAEFLVFDPEFPHSVRYAVDRVSEALAQVAPGAPPTRRTACERLAGRLKSAIDFGQLEDLSTTAIDRFLVGISRQCEQIHDAVYAAYLAYDAEAVL
jgi:uncharacterized alpha-E superfamily protein